MFDIKHLHTLDACESLYIYIYIYIYIYKEIQNKTKEKKTVGLNETFVVIHCTRYSTRARKVHYFQFVSDLV